MISIKATASGTQKLIKNLEAERLRHIKAEQAAVKVRGFKLMYLLREELSAGAPGGRRLAPLSIIHRTMRAQFSKTGRLGADKPLRAMAKSVGYDDETIPGTTFVAVRLGFGLSKVAKLNSSSWRRIAKMQQEGFTQSASERMFRHGQTTIEQFFRYIGSQVDYKTFGKKKARRRNVFFLRKTTTTLKTPAREVLEPFWAAHRADAIRKIRRDFLRKLAGERV